MQNKPQHIAFIMDGNGRWAKQRLKPRTFGHSAGVKRIFETIKAAIDQEIKYISFFAFSTENWNRPEDEVDFLMTEYKKNIMDRKTDKKTNWYIENGVKFRWIGFKDKLDQKILDSIEKLESDTKNNNVIQVNICFNYGAQQEIINACQKLIDDKLEANKNNFEKCLLTFDSPDVDLLIRTSGEQRISNFLLWQIAYAEIIFEKVYWPDYDKSIFADNLLEYSNRNRRFGGLDNGTKKTS